MYFESGEFIYLFIIVLIYIFIIVLIYFLFIYKFLFYLYFMAIKLNWFSLLLLLSLMLYVHGKDKILCTLLTVEIWFKFLSLNCVHIETQFQHSTLSSRHWFNIRIGSDDKWLRIKPYFPLEHNLNTTSNVAVCE